jgi:uncharacterized protein
VSVSTRSPYKFFALVFALSTPFFLIGALTTFEVIPGVPVSGLALVCPVIAAMIMVRLESGRAGVIALLKRAFDWKRIKGKIWFAPMILLAPAAALFQFGFMRFTAAPLPTQHLPGVMTLVLAFALLVGALCEELGWSGYAIDPLQERWGALQASLLVGVAWAIWHFVPLVQVGRSPSWIAWWCLGTVALRVLIVWLYYNAGKSVFAAAVLHAMSNFSWQMFPINGSLFDPRINGVIMAVLAIVVVMICGPRTLNGRETVAEIGAKSAAQNLK